MNNSSSLPLMKHKLVLVKKRKKKRPQDSDLEREICDEQGDQLQKECSRKLFNRTS